MALVPGTRFGPYEIADQIGAGGMGEVYRARDTNLKRDVAIKVLAESFASDADRLARLQIEAEALASLNHLNVAHIYGLERVGEATALVMELIDGPTLADKIALGPISVDEALTIATQIADAIEAAHRQGIVHRDLKPANVKLRPDGVVKVLDFGIAKTVEGPVPSSGPGSPVMTTPALTQTGMILGTATYMSPEQARGMPLDKRTDIWAFGAVLYEMLSGQPPFLGEDVTETIAAVLKSEPDWNALPELPPLVLVFLKQCLQKKPQDRVHDIADVRLALANRFDVSELVPADGPGQRRTKSSARMAWTALALAILGLVVAGVVSWTGGTRPAGSSATVRQLTFRHGGIGTARFASDGEVIVYGAAWDDEPYSLYTTRLSSYQSRPLDLPPADLLAVSSANVLALSMARQAADGWLPRGELAQVGLAGGAPRVIGDGVVSVDWGPDGEIAAIVRRVDGQSQIEFPVGTVVHRADMIGPVRLSPDGNRACFTTSYNNLMLAERGGAAEVLKPEAPRIGECAWSPRGNEVWFTYSPNSSMHTNLEAISLDGRSRRVLAAFPAFARLQDVSPDGAALIAGGELRFSAYGALSIGGRERDLGIFGVSRVTGIDATGTHILITENSTGSRATGGSLFLRPMDGSAPIQFDNGQPLGITPDGKWIAVLGDSVNSVFDANMITLVPTGAGAARTVELPVSVQFTGGNRLGIHDWSNKYPGFSRDGQRLLLPYARDAEGTVRSYVHDFVEDWTKAVTPEGVTGPIVLSPDGRFVASNEPGGLFIYSVDTGERMEVPGGRDPGILAQWGTADEFLYLLEYHGASATVARRSVRTGEREILGEVRAPDPAGVTRFDVWIARDGEAYAYTLDRRTDNLFILENLD